MARTKFMINCCIVVALLISLPVLLATCQITQYTVQLDDITRIMQYGPITTSVIVKVSFRFFKYSEIYSFQAGYNLTLVGYILYVFVYWFLILRKFYCTKAHVFRKMICFF